MDRLSEKVRIAIVWVLFLIVFAISGMLLNNRLLSMVYDYICAQVATQAEYTAETASNEMFRETDKLTYISRLVERYGSASKRVLDAVSYSDEHSMMGLQTLNGGAVSGAPLPVSEYPAIQEAFRGNIAIDNVPGKGLLFTCPVYNNSNVKYVIYELLDRYALKDRMSINSSDSRKIIITTMDGTIVMPFDNVTDEELKDFENEELDSVFSDLSKKMELKTSYAEFREMNGEDFIFFVSDIPNTSFRMRGYMSSDIMTTGLVDAISIVIFVFAFLLVLYAVGTLYLMIAAEKAGESDELRKAKMQAEEANKAKSDFLASMSHEIRTPINAVLGMDEMIIRESDNDHILEYANSINNAGKSLLNLVNDILDFSKIEAGKMEILPAEYKTSFMISDLVSMIAVRAHNKGLELNVNADPSLPTVLYGDEDRVKQCVINILTNAVKYTEKGSVTFDMTYEKVSDKEIMLKVKVTDTGIGIRKEDQQRLFSPFERVDEQRNRNIEGTGLGLSIVRKLLTIMDSELKLESEYGKGSTFYFDLKQEVCDWKEMGDFAEAYRKSVLTRNKYTELFRAPDARILVVDDTVMNLNVVKGLLKKTRIMIDTAVSGHDTLKLAKKQRYDIMFIDHRMPVMDGVETLKALESLEGNLNMGVPCIAFTANAGSGSREQYRSYGFTDYISKPVSPSELEQMIVKYLPPDKIELIDPDSVHEESEEANNTDEAFVESYKKAEGLNYNVAIAGCGDDALLKDTAITFYNAVDDNIAEIRRALANDDIENYTIKVHALKSSARIIGAVDLSRKAEYLERCGNEQDREEIAAHTDFLIDDYLRIRESLKFIINDYLKNMSKEESAEDNFFKEAISREKLKEFTESVKDAVSLFDFDSINDSIRLLKEYKLTRELENELKELSSAADRLEEEEVIKIIDAIEILYTGNSENT